MLGAKQFIHAEPASPGQLGSVVNEPAMVSNNRFQRAVMDEVPRHESQRAAAEPGR